MEDFASVACHVNSSKGILIATANEEVPITAACDFILYIARKIKTNNFTRNRTEMFARSMAPFYFFLKLGIFKNYNNYRDIQYIYVAVAQFYIQYTWLSFGVTTLFDIVDIDVIAINRKRFHHACRRPGPQAPISPREITLSQAPLGTEGKCRVC